MTPFAKALLAVAFVVPLVAYVAGTLASTGVGVPEQQGTVYINDVDPASEIDPSTDPSTGPSAEPSATPSPSRPSPPRDNQPTPGPHDAADGTRSGDEARVVGPAPVEDDDERDDDDDDGDDTDDDTDD